MVKFILCNGNELNPSGQMVPGSRKVSDQCGAFRRVGRGPVFEDLQFGEFGTPSLLLLQPQEQNWEWTHLKMDTKGTFNLISQKKTNQNGPQHVPFTQ